MYIQKINTWASTYLQKPRLNSEGIKYIISGVISNLVGYLFYLIATLLLGFGHKIAMTTLYILASIINFYVNRRWTFDVRGRVKSGLIRFFLVIVLGYFLNLAGLFIFVDLVGWPHEQVQLAAIAVMAIYFFVMNKYYVHK